MKKLILFVLILILSTLLLGVENNSEYGIDNFLESTILKGNWKESIEIIKKDSTKVRNPIARLIVAHACLATNLNNEALRLFVSVNELEDLDKWIEWTRTLMNSNPDNNIALYLAGDAEARIGDLTGAIDLFTKAIKLKNDFALAYNAQGVVNILNKKWDSAYVDFYKAVNFMPLLADAQFNLGNISVIRCQGSIEEGSLALESFNNAIEINSEFSLAYNGRGCLYFGNGEFEKAARDFNKAQEINPILAIPEINYGISVAYASKLITALREMENNPSTTLESIQKKSINQQIFDKPFKDECAFLPDHKINSLVEEYGRESVKMAMAYDIQRSMDNIVNSSYLDKNYSQLKTMQYSNIRNLVQVDVSNSLIQSGSNCIDNKSADSRDWDSYKCTANNNYSTEKMRQLDENRIRNLANDLASSYGTSLISSLTPSLINNLTTIYDFVNLAAADQAKTPFESIDRLSTIAALGGSTTTYIVPIIKTYWRFVFDVFAMSDVSMQSAIIDAKYQPSQDIAKLKQNSNIKGYYINHGQPIENIGFFTSEINNNDQSIIGTSNRVLIVSNDPFRSTLQQQDLLYRNGFDTRVIAPDQDVMLEARSWGANTILGIQGNLTSTISNINTENISKKNYSEMISSNISIPSSSGLGDISSWDTWGKPYTYIPHTPVNPTEPEPGGVTTKDIAKSFVDKGKWPVMTSFNLFYKISILEDEKNSSKEEEK